MTDLAVRDIVWLRAQWKAAREGGPMPVAKQCPSSVPTRPAGDGEFVRRIERLTGRDLVLRSGGRR